MKSVKEDNGCCGDKPFPKLMRGITSGAIFFMKDKDGGVCVHVGNQYSATLGSISSTWGLGMTDYNGSICLSND